jgi:hypothetical protein
VLNEEYGWITLDALATAEIVYLSTTENGRWIDCGWWLTAADTVRANQGFPAWKTGGWFKPEYYNDGFIDFVFSPGSPGKQECE